MQYQLVKQILLEESQREAGEKWTPFSYPSCRRNYLIRKRNSAGLRSGQKGFPSNERQIFPRELGESVGFYQYNDAAVNVSSLAGELKAKRKAVINIKFLTTRNNWRRSTRSSMQLEHKPLMKLLGSKRVQPSLSFM